MADKMLQGEARRHAAKARKARQLLARMRKAQVALGKARDQITLARAQLADAAVTLVDLPVFLHLDQAGRTAGSAAGELRTAVALAAHYVDEHEHQAAQATIAAGIEADKEVV